MVIKRILRALGEAASRDRNVVKGFSNPATFCWRCECGATSRGPDIKAEAQFKAQRHQLRKEMGHPLPEVYSVE
ncbi:hypothetical protein J3A78_003849 [Streptomyces sp. PvR006]|uniref:hypothetical protein n=1 Tax=Streptomyces sp. PvR006 TaxID=2817860 RepID=UPI001AE26E68|nr:hypothetical protein [Streptomyces sp. PvR006]MBP2583371.1 hypothetical protein [Streptomyces sp. PvR006]